MRTSDQTGPSKVVVFAEKEEMADTIWSLLDHAIHQSSLSYKATPWTFWPHVIFKIGIPLFFASSGSQVKAVSPADWTILEVSDSEYSDHR